MKILELTNYSAGICGVWQRVKQESEFLSKKGYNVMIFSSNFIKGKDKIASEFDETGNIRIRRFTAKKLGGESFMRWDFEKEALKYKPDIIIAHSYRHLHTKKALKIAKKLGAKVFLVTHAPFDRSSTRSFISKIIVKAYDIFIGKRILNKFDKIIVITKWEISYFLKLGCKKEKIIYIPNGISEEFLKQKKSKEQNKILFLGRISPIKNLETLILAMKFIKDRKIILEIVGPAERDYFIKLKKLIKEKKLSKRIKFSEPIYNLKNKIKKIDSCKIFALPSKSEGMPQSLIEAMVREKMVISSNNLGAKDLIINEENGYLFDIGNEKQLAKKIDFALYKPHFKIKKKAKKSVEKFSINNLIEKLENLF
jgi:L-malate glycosyltransferase